MLGFLAFLGAAWFAAVFGLVVVATLLPGARGVKSRDLG